MPSTPPHAPAAEPPSFTPLVCVVDFHHARGPEIEHWIGGNSAANPDDSADNDWSLIPYMALPDGAHSLTEEFSYFTLVWKSPGSKEAEVGQEKTQGGSTAASTDGSETSVFGISCTQQVDASKLVWKSEEVTRSAVQKAVVVLTDRPGEFGRLREKLSVVTRAWFAQRDFRDVEILEVGFFLSFFLGSWFWGLGIEIWLFTSIEGISVLIRLVSGLEISGEFGPRG